VIAGEQGGGGPSAGVAKRARTAKDRALPVATLLLWILSLVLAAVAVWLDAVNHTPGSLICVQLPLVLEVLAFTTAGALVASRQPRNPVGWLLLAEGLTWEVVGSLAAFTRHAQVAEPGRLNLEALAAWTLNWVWIPAFGVLAVLFLLFPDGRLPGRRWRVVPWVAAAGAAATFLARALAPGPLAEAPAVVNPFGVRGGEVFHALEGVGSPLLALAVIAAIASLVVRFRRADGVERRQLKWLALAGVVVVVGSGLADAVELAGVAWIDSGNLFLASLAGIPIAAAIAILRYRLYDIDLVIGRAFVLAGLLGFITAVYLAVVVGIGTAVGRTAGSNVVLAVVATAVVALAFHPLRSRLQQVARRLVLRPPSLADEPADVTIRCLGAFRVLRCGQPVPATAWQSKKARTLLKILVARRGRATPRLYLMDTLWPDEDPEPVSRRLSVALATARAVLDPDKRHPPERFIVADKDSLRLDLANVPVDAERFLRLAAEGLAGHREAAARARATLQAAEEAYAGDFLEEDRYEEWAEPLREEARAAYVSVARALAEIAAAARDHDAAVRYYLRILEKDAFDERAHLGLVATLHREGRHGEARRQYRTYAARMVELEVPAAPFPGPERD
jgi:DNA-binding SARP family transcriptional activator